MKTITCIVLNLSFGCQLLAGGPENAVLVVNADSASSKLIANYYQHWRNIPQENVIYLTDIPATEVLNVKLFREKILGPVIATIDQRKLASHIDYIIYSSDFPTIIDARADRNKQLAAADQESGAESNEQAAMLTRMFNPYISLNAATYFYRHVLSEDTGYLSLTANTFYRQPSQSLLAIPFVGEDSRVFNKAMVDARNQELDAAIEGLENLARKHPLQLAVVYWLARCYAWKDDSESAILWLKRALAVGWCYQDALKADQAFEKLADHETFQALVAITPNVPFRYAPTQSFNGTYFWGPNGMVNSTPDQGNRYLLSTVLAVNRNQGNSERESLAYLQASVAADATRPNGHFYFTNTPDVRSRTRERGIKEAVNELEMLGFRTETVSTPLPEHRGDILGLSSGTAKFEWITTGNQIVPGAICENLTSFGGRLAGSPAQTKLTEFLRYGAAGSSGTVIEPFAVQEKFPHPRIHVHYVRGCTLAEAFYQSVHGPFQLLIVGDALCRPWAQIPTLVVSGTDSHHPVVRDEWTFQVDGSQSPIPIRLIEMYVNGTLVRRIEGNQTGQVNIDTRSMPDGYHELRFVAVALGPIATRGSVVIPVTVNNSDRSVKLSVRSPDVSIEDEISFVVEASGASEIQIVHNGRSVKTVEGESGSFRLPAFTFGRGPISLQAMAKIQDQYIRSQPLNLQIKGAIATTIPIMKPTPAPKKKPKQNHAN